MAQSLPSQRFANIDVPEITNFNAKFVYNFFTIDEKTNETGTNNNLFDKRLNEEYTMQIIDNRNYQRFIPRFVRFNWNIKSNLSRNENELNISIIDNFDKIHNEQTFVSDNYTAVLLQNTNQNNVLSFILNRALQEIQKRQNQTDIQSPLDVVKFLNNNTNENVNPNFLSNSFIKLLNDGIIFNDNNGNDDNNIIKQLSDNKTRIQINNKFIENILNTTKHNTLNIFDNSITKQIKQAKEIQHQAISQKNSNILNSLDYEFEILEFVSVKSVNPAAFTPKFQIIGYVIDKEEILFDGTTQKKEPIIIESNTISETVDFKVKYGTRYSYSIRSIALMENTIQDVDTNDILVMTFLVSSQPSKKVIIETEELIAPPVPADFNITYDYKLNTLRLMWNFPVNPQRDIKQFQIFRRENIFEPFELIKQYNFDDSEIKSEQKEFPDEQLVEFLSSPKNYYLDKEFTKDKSYIYAICSIDAHGFSSNYSTQFQISFDKFSNKIRKEIVSLSDAPKSYPNMYIINNQTFVNSIKTSNHNEVKIVFNPEYLKVTDNENNDLHLLKTDNGSKYKLQLINIDLQEQQVIDIFLKDRRTTAEKEEDD